MIALVGDEQGLSPRTHMTFLPLLFFFCKTHVAVQFITITLIFFSSML